MPDVDTHTPSDFCWAELATTDTNRAKAFYSELFGWNVADTPIPGGGVYTMLEIRGRPVAALFDQRKEEAAQGIPAHWTSYVAVRSADETAAKAQANGGTILAPAFDVMDVGRMAVIADPAGSVFAIWQARKHPGAMITREPGTMVWNELNTRDVEGAKRFYGEVFGWQTETRGSQMEYTEIANGQKKIGGMMAIQPEWGPVPPNWVVYFGTTDCEGTVERATRLGGKVIVPTMEISGGGKFSVLQDPTGATFAVYREGARG